MYTLVLVVHVLVCLVLVVVVLLQSSKGGGLAGAFGGAGGAPQQILGTRGMTTLLHKVTIYCGAAFFVTSFLLFTLSGTGGSAGSSSVINEAASRGDLPAATTTIPESAVDVFSLPEANDGTEGEATTPEGTPKPQDLPAAESEPEGSGTPPEPQQGSRGSGSGDGKP